MKTSSVEVSARGLGLSSLIALDSLKVGPAVVYPSRIETPYVLTCGKKVETFELVYRYEEDVFEPGTEESKNLANLTTAQVALNYGLFCKKIELLGPFDREDCRFLTEMAKNTAREIYLNKFFKPNPFLIERWKMLPLEKRPQYLQAKLVFNHIKGTGKLGRLLSGSSSNRVGNKIAVLSSGGKDSLLTFCALREIGFEVHPIFINESGRHWFTALNAYRHFTAKVAHTARVWTNSDQLFCWMLRHLPFIRTNFADICADTYPIRLWTIAVFLFGTLPLLRKRGIEHLAIGDEYDATAKMSFHGITDYGGFYDQGFYFDNALSRYYLRKDWKLCQFSILRPLSELLIQKILVERYPDIQKYQMSCHATHKEGFRVYPCGKCEKCRRIVTMLLALGADPSVCGYSEAKQLQCLEQFLKKSANQEKAGLEHLYYLLHKRGLISKNSKGKNIFRERTEILKLRFHPQKSPVDAIPVELREPIYRIFLSHAEGTLLRENKKWIDTDVLTLINRDP